jgi:hypothetical protein
MVIIAVQMNKKVIRKSNLQDLQSVKKDLSYWLSRPATERVAAVDHLRKQYYGRTGKIQRIVRVINLADLEALGEE